MDNASPNSTPTAIADQANHPALAGLVHLAALFLALATGWIAGLGGAVVGVVVWAFVSDKQSLLARHAAEVFNFNFSLFIYAIAAFFAVVLTLGLGLIVAIPLALVFALIWLVFSVMGAIAGFNGREFRYPLSIRWIR